MIITAALAWFNEAVKDLETCVFALRGIADRLIAIDGAYARYPNAAPSSPPEQGEAILRAAEKIGIEAQVWVPDRVWAGQTQKRDQLLELAAEPPSDWILQVDTDHICHGYFPEAKSELEKTEHDIVDIDIYEPVNVDKPLLESSAGEWHRTYAGKVCKHPAFYRALPGFRVERTHWYYSALKNGKRVWLLYKNEIDPARETLKRYELQTWFQVEHRCLFRDEKHILENRSYCNDREGILKTTGQEDELPGMEAPALDFKRLPI